MKRKHIIKNYTDRYQSGYYKVCHICGCQYYVYESSIKQGRGKFCSKKCSYSTFNIRWKGKNNPRWKNGKMNGEGTFTYQDGTKYEVEWKDGKIVKKRELDESKPKNKLQLSQAEALKSNITEELLSL